MMKGMEQFARLQRKKYYLLSCKGLILYLFLHYIYPPIAIRLHAERTNPVGWHNSNFVQTQWPCRFHTMDRGAFQLPHATIPQLVGLRLNNAGRYFPMRSTPCPFCSQDLTPLIFAHLQ